uniref:tRNA selenocysteine-associated protein 1 n=1 Tax=Schistosoma haematobium TaxID=6185 RepID=A0A094ZZ83_SCHHA
MGDLEPYMDEMFIKRAFETSGENIVSVKVIRNKATGQTLGYGFIEFANSTSARDAMLKLNGKLIPGAPVSFIRIIRPLDLNFKLNKSFFVMTNGKSRGYGFVRFLTESDMDKALIEMQNYCGLGYKPIRVSLAIPKRYNADGSLVVTTTASETSSVVPSGMPDPFTAAVAAAVTGNSAAQAEYYQAYQQYYQQYYASQYAAQFYSSESSTNGDLANSGITSIAGGGTLVGDATVQQHAFVDAAASHLYARALQQGTGSHEYAPEPHVLSSACDRPRHVDDLDEVFNFLEASRWHVTDPSLGLFIKIRP